MTITQLEKDGKYKVMVFLDGVYRFFLYEKEVRRLQLETGDEITDQLLEEIEQLILLPRAKNKALALLQYKSRTMYELRQKLKEQGYPENIVSDVMEFLLRYGFLDDYAYVRSYIDLYGGRKSRLQLQMELSRKGISKEIFQALWEEQESDFEEEALKGLIEKRIRQKGPVTRENFQKHYAYFARKGYPSSSIVRLLKEYQ